MPTSTSTPNSGRSSEPARPRPLISQRSLPDVAASAVRALASSGAQVAAAESLTAGLVMSSLAAIPGVSAWLAGGVVAYTHDVKANVLGVSRELLEKEGAVNEEVALQMAKGIHQLTGARFTLATTGVAGPGPAEGKDEGTVVCAVVDNAMDTSIVATDVFQGGRMNVREAAAGKVLDLLEIIVIRSREQNRGEEC